MSSPPTRPCVAATDESPMSAMHAFMRKTVNATSCSSKRSTALAYLSAPSYPVLLTGGRKELKLSLLKRWSLPTKKFELCHKHRSIILKTSNFPRNDAAPSSSCLPPCERVVNRLIHWHQVWLASDEDLYFLLLMVPECAPSCLFDSTTGEAAVACCDQCCPKCLIGEEPQALQGVTTRFPSISASSQRAAILEAKTRLLSLLSDSFKYPLSDIAVRLWIDKLSDNLSRLINQYIPRNRISIGQDQPIFPMNAAILHPAILPAPSALHGWGVFLRSAEEVVEDVGGLPPIVRAGTILASIEENSAVNVYSALHDEQFSKAAIELLSQQADCDVVLMLYIIYDAYVRINTRRAWYYNSMPPAENEQSHSLLLAPPEVLEFLDVPAITQHVEHEMTSLFTAYQCLSSTVFPKFPDIFVPSFFTWDKFLWSRWIIDSRGFSLMITPPQSRFFTSSCKNDFVTQQLPEDTDGEEDDEFLDTSVPNIGAGPIPLLAPPSTSSTEKELFQIRLILTENMNPVSRPASFDIPKRVTCLLPIMDMFNHHPIGHCRPAQFNEAKRCFEISSEVDLQCQHNGRQEIFLSYGPFETWQSLLYYGFCPSVAPSTDGVAYPILDTLTVEFEIEDEKDRTEVLMKHLGVSQIHLLRACDSGDPAIAPQLTQFLNQFASSKSLSTVLENLLLPILAKISQLQSWSVADQPHWYLMWHGRLLNFFESRRDLLLSHLKSL